jgi:hypothetical protein
MPRGRALITKSQWRPEAVDSADLATGLKAARTLQSLPVPAVLSKQLSNYALRAERELAARSEEGDAEAVEARGANYYEQRPGNPHARGPGTAASAGADGSP